MRALSLKVVEKIGQGEKKILEKRQSGKISYNVFFVIYLIRIFQLMELRLCSRLMCGHILQA